MKNIDYSLYLITDRSILKNTSLEYAVEQAILGGVTLVQLREKNMTSMDFYKSALSVKKVTDNYNIPLIINDRLDIALACGANGVHLGQSDIPADTARHILGDDKVIGITAPTIESAVKAEKDGADYIGVGAMFPTSTKRGTVANTKENLIKIVHSVKIPVVAIGGINIDNAVTIADTGINGFAVVSALLGSSDIKHTAEKFRKILGSDINETERNGYKNRRFSNSEEIFGNQ